MKTEMRSIFRIALVAYVVVAAFLVLKILVIGPGALPDPAIAYLTWWMQQPLTEFGKVVLWIGNLTFAGSIVGALGMLVFARWARPLFALCIVVLSGAEFFADMPVLRVPVEHAISSLLSVLAGAIIVFAYWSRVSDAFARKATQPNEGLTT